MYDITAIVNMPTDSTLVINDDCGRPYVRVARSATGKFYRVNGWNGFDWERGETLDRYDALDWLDEMLADD